LKPSAKRAKPFGLKELINLDQKDNCKSIFSPKRFRNICHSARMGLARLAEGFNPARGNGEVIYPSFLSGKDIKKNLICAPQ
jgi:hypothetical protein